MSTRPASAAAAPIGVGVLERERDRLLQQHVLAGRQRALGDRTVQRRRQADVDDVDARCGDRGLPVAGHVGPEAVRDRVRTVERADDAHLRAVAQRAVGARMHAGHEAAADERDVRHDRPSAANASYDARIERLTSSSGGQGTPPVNSISTE